jgi:hypothetical protein
MNKFIYFVGLATLLYQVYQAPVAASPSYYPAESYPAAQSPVQSPMQSPVQSPVQGSQPIPSDLGLQFDLSDSQTVPQPVQSVPAQTTPFQTKPFQTTPFQTGPVPVRPAPEQFQPVTQPPVAIAPAVTSPAVIGALEAKPPLNLFQQATFTLKQLFEQGSDSLIAVAVGNAEGTRTPSGSRSKHFYGHSDPGNGVWNLGTFSYQHGANSAEAADDKQIARLKQQARVMQEKAVGLGLKLSLEETLNGIDLANQAPKALLDSQGYVEWLAQAHQQGLSGTDAILWARVQSFIDPQTQQWNAPGLGNTAESISRDQNRRIQAIAKAVQAQNRSIAADARLDPQPIGFRLPKLQWHWNRVAQQVSAWFTQA